MYVMYVESKEDDDARDNIDAPDRQQKDLSGFCRSKVSIKIVALLAVGLFACSRSHTDSTSELNKIVKPTRSTCNVDEETSVRHSNKGNFFFLNYNYKYIVIIERKAHLWCASLLLRVQYAAY